MDPRRLIGLGSALLVAGALACSGGSGHPGTDLVPDTVDPGPADTPASDDAAGDADGTDADTSWPEGVLPLDPPPAAIPAGGLPAESAFDQSDRPRLDLSGTWRFMFDDDDAGVTGAWYGTGFDRSGWLDAPVPGTWDLDVPGGFDLQTVGWYAREFAWTDPSPFVRLRFEGVFREARAWLNGQELGGDDLPYLPFSFDVTDRLRRDGPNVLVVRIDNRMDRQTLPCDTSENPGRHGWFPYGGILRPVVVEGAPAVSVARVQVRTAMGDVAGRVQADLRLQRAAGGTGNATLTARVLQAGQVVLAWDAATIPPGVEGIHLEGLVPLPEIWDPSHPDRTLRLEVRLDDGTASDTVGTDFAFKTFQATAGRFLLNGWDHYLHGINRHEDHPVRGPVFDADAMAADVAAMKDLHVDFARTAHYPNDVRTLRALEAAGILLAEEIPVYQWDPAQLADPVLLDRAQRALQRMIARDANRPAIGMWSIANEVWSFTDEAVPFFRALRATARQMDPDRPVMAAVFVMPVLSFSEVDRAPEEVDVLGVNEYFGWYEGTGDEVGTTLDQAHERFPAQTIFGSEYGCDAVRGRHLYAAPGEEPVDAHSYSEEFQAWFHRQHLRQYAERDFVRGVMPWVLADFRMQWNPSTGKPHPVDRTNLKGLVDGWRVPKQAYAVLREAFSDPDGLAVPDEPACNDGRTDPAEACDHGTTPCAGLGSSWESGTATCRSDCTGWDVSACTRKEAPAESWEVVKPAERDPARWGDARCNDGTPFAFRVRLSPSGSKDWVISLRGGGFCDDFSVPCIRAEKYVTTLAQADGEFLVPGDDNGGLFDVQADANPAWHDANWAFGPYCSSDFWLGTRTARVPALGDPENGWYFSGRLNVQALLESLVRRYGLADAPGAEGPRVMFGGTSAGGLGTLGTADLAATMLPRTAAAGRLKILVDAGWLVHDWDETDARLGMAEVGDAEVVREAHRHFQARLNPACEEARVRAGQDPGDCLLGLVAFPYLVSPAPAGLGLPVLFQQSLEDTSFSGFHNHDEDAAFQVRYGERQLADALAADPGEPLKATWFLGRSAYHDICRWTDRWTKGDPGNTFREVLERFWAGGTPERVIWTPVAPGT